MTEKEHRPDQLQEFRERFESGLSEFLELVEQLEEVPLPPDPASMDIDDSRTLEDLNRYELLTIAMILVKELQIDPEDPSFLIRTYQSQSDLGRVPGNIDIKVFKTNRPNIFLQELTFSDRAVRWVLGPDMDI